MLGISFLVIVTDRKYYHIIINITIFILTNDSYTIYYYSTVTDWVARDDHILYIYMYIYILVN